MDTHQLYNQGLLGLADGDIDWADATNVAAVLLTSDYTPDLSGHSTYGDLTDEVTDSDYDPVAVTNRSISLDSGDVEYDADDVNFGSDVTITARYMVFVLGDPASLSSTDRLISLSTADEDKSSTSSDWRVNAPSNGWFRLSESS